MKLRSGHIPLDVVYVFSSPKKVAPFWEDEEQREDGKERHVEVIPAFVSDASNEKSIKAGVRWATDRSTIWNTVTKQGEMTVPVTKIQRENKPISGVRVIGLEPNFEGMRTHKVLMPDGLYFDIQADVLLDVMLTEGVEPGGLLLGEYVWANIDSVMKLVRVGSTFFDALLESGERSILATIPKGQLRVGTVYESKLGDRGIFLGNITTESWSVKWPNGLSSWSNHYMKTKDKPKLVAKKLNRHMLWFDVSSRSITEQEEMSKLFQEAIQEQDISSHFKLRASHAMVKVVGSVAVPDDVVEQVRIRALSSYKNKVEKRSSTERVYIAAPAAAALLMRLVGHQRPIVDDPEFQRFEQLVGQELGFVVA